MMKLVQLIAMCLLALTSFGQTTILDHEAPLTTTNFSYFGNCFLDATQNSVVANPDPTGDNTSAMVGDFVRTNCAATFAGCFGDPAPSVAVDLTSDNKIRMKVWMDHVGTIDFKLEGSSDGGDNWLTQETITDLNQWVTVEFDAAASSLEPPFTAAAGFTYNQVVIFFDLGAPASGVDETSYFDDIETFFDGTLAQIDLPVDFEGGATDYTLTDFGDNMSVLAADPDGSANTVVCTTKPVTAPTWAGTTMGTPAGFANAIPISASNTEMTVRVYSPDAGIPVLLKIEDASDPTKSVETITMTTVANAWETLVFDFANEAPGTAALNLTYTFNKASIFFNFGTDGATAGEKTYYWDDVMFDGTVALAQIDLPVDFEGTTTDYTLTDFGDNGSVLAADPDGSANTVVCTTKPVSAPVWAGTTMSTPAGFANAIPITATETKMSVRVYSPDAGIPVLLKIEDSADPTKSVETITMTTVANAWETLEFDFANEAPGTAALDLTYTYDKASIFFNFGTDGATAGEKTYYWDDVMFIEAVSTQIDLPVDFESAIIDYTLTDFGDNMSVLAADPDGSANTVVCTTKPVSAPLWAGTTMGTPAGFANAIPITATETKMSVRVYSPDAGIPVLLKIEDASDPTKSVETITMTTVANAWETLVFDFANEAPGTATLNLTYTFDKASIFFNFGTDGATAGEKTYYWDDAMMAADVACSTVDAPTGLSSTFDAAGVTLAWNAIPASIGCMVEGQEVLPGGGLGPLLYRRIIGTEVTAQFIPNAQLDLGATYQWHVRCACAQAAINNATPYSAFTMFSMPVLRTAEVTSNSPVSNTAYLTVKSFENSEVNVQLVDLNGRVVGNWMTQLVEGSNNIQLELGAYPNGFYLLNLEGADIDSAKKILIQH